MSFRLIEFLVIGLSLASELQAQNVVRSFGTSFSASATNLSVEIPNKSFRGLPKEMYEYLVEQPTEFKREVVELLIDTATLKPEEKTAFKSRIDNSILRRGRTVLKGNAQTNLVISPDTGTLIFRFNSGGGYSVLSSNDQKRVVGFDVFEAKLKQLMQKGGWDDSEIERKENGDYRIQVADTSEYPHHQKEPVLVERSVSYFRQLDKCAIVTYSLFEIQLTRRTSGEWKVIFMHWPRFKRIASVPVIRSNEDIKNALLENRGVWDNANTVSPEDAKSITVTGVRLAYFHSKDSNRVQPALILDADVKTQGETIDGVIYLPLIGKK